MKLLTAVAVAFGSSNAALADELFLGAGSHDLITPLASDVREGGVDLQAGYRGDPIKALDFIGAPSPYVLASINTVGDTSLVAAGLSWKFGEKIYIRPGIGLAVHDGPSFRLESNGDQTQLGSRVLFEPELAVGVRLSDTVDLEASWIHVSHARLFDSKQNPGLDIIGLRLVIGLP